MSGLTRKIRLFKRVKLIYDLRFGKVSTVCAVVPPLGARGGAEDFGVCYHLEYIDLRCTMYDLRRTIERQGHG